MGQRFVGFCARFAGHFRLRTHDVSMQSGHYLCGLMQARRKNMERMAEVVPESDDQALQHFLSNSPWDARAVLGQVASEADALLGGTRDSALLIDESGFTKKGRHSVGVARQWNGRLGKVDNCQVGVFAALSRGPAATLIDYTAVSAGVPGRGPRSLRGGGYPGGGASGPEQGPAGPGDGALQSVVGSALRVGWTGRGVRQGSALLRSFEDDGEIFVADVHRDQFVYLEDPRRWVPASPGGRGRKRTRLIAQTEALRVDAWVHGQPPSAWQRLRLRDSTRVPGRSRYCTGGCGCGMARRRRPDAGICSAP